MRHHRRMRARPAIVPELFKPWRWKEVSGPQTPGMPGADPIKLVGEPSFFEKQRPIPFEFITANVILPALGVASGAAGSVPNVSPSPGPAPAGMRAQVDAVECWAIDVFGRHMGALPFFAISGGDRPDGLQLLWSVLVDNRPMLQLKTPRVAEGLMVRSLLEVGPGQVLSTSMTVQWDPSAIVAAMVIRLRGNYIPLNTKAAGL